MGRIKNIFKGDTVIWVIFFFLCLISIVEIYSATSTMSYRTGAYWAPMLWHSMFLVLGTVVVLIVQFIPCRLFRLLPVVLLPLSLILLVWVQFSGAINDASRWLTLFGIQFQPSEIAKGTLVISTALLLSIARQGDKVSKQVFWWILGISGVFCVLIGTENMSTAGILFMVILFMMIIGEVPWKQLAGLCAILAITGGIGFSVLRFTPIPKLQAIAKTYPFLQRLPTWGARLQTESRSDSISARDYNLADNLQRAHANIAIATSNVIGKMPGNSVERDFLPQAYSDFIYAIIIEELGLIGGAFVAFLYIVLLFRAGRIASRCERYFPAYLIMGLALLMVSQALLNMMVAVGLFPITGQPLPLISRGGTSIVINCAYVGIMLSISRYAKKKKELNENQLITSTLEAETEEYYSEENMV